MALPVIFFILILYGYALVILIYSFEIDQKAGSTGEVDSGRTRPVSVIIPFRNEEKRLAGIVNDLASQSYPDELYEVIFIDDHSDDGSLEELKSLMELSRLPGKGFYIHSLPPGKSGKKAALSYGIEHAKNEWIIQVDADCRIRPGFVASHLSFLENHPSDLVAGPVIIRRGGGKFLERFERLDLLSLVGIAAGSFGLGRPMMCNGANLAYSKGLYRETRAFDPEHSISSGDDMFLMIGARKLGKRLTFATNRELVAETEPAGDLRKMIAQRIRWGSKTKFSGMGDIQWLAVLVSVANMIIFLLPLWMILMAGVWPWLIGGLLLKTFADFMLLWRITGVTGNRADLRWFLPVLLAYYPIFTITMTGALLGKPTWKRGVS